MYRKFKKQAKLVDQERDQGAVTLKGGGDCRGLQRTSGAILCSLIWVLETWVQSLCKTSLSCTLLIGVFFSEHSANFVL